MSFDKNNPEDYGFDAGIEFVPQSINFKADSFPDKVAPTIVVKNKLIDINYEGTVYDYRWVVLDSNFHKPYHFPTYKCVMPSWDNDARKKGNDSVSFHFSNPDLYGRWLDTALSAQPLNNIVFINAWNEWAEGTTLEPSMHYGHALLNRTAEVLATHSKSKENKERFPAFGLTVDNKPELAVVVHLYYPEKWEYIRKKLGLLQGKNWDLYVTLTQKEKEFAPTIIGHFPGARIVIVPNRGRDILPFVHLARRLEQVGYKQVLKLHTKKSPHRKDGKAWFEDLIDNLLPNKLMVNKVLSLMSQEDALIGPKGHYLALDRYLGSNSKHLDTLLSKIDKPNSVDFDPTLYSYFGGSMFWATLDCIKPILELYLMPEDFEAENGQIDGTMAHAVERLFGIVPQMKDTRLYSLNRWRLEKLTISKTEDKYKYVR